MEQTSLPVDQEPFSTPLNANFQAATLQIGVGSHNINHFGSRLPALADLNGAGRSSAVPGFESCTSSQPSRIIADSQPWTITETHYDKLCIEVLTFSRIIPDGCTLPTRHTLTRYLEKYIRCVQEYLPFIHIPTLQIEQRPIELVLAMAVLGAQYSFDRIQSYEIYFIARAIVTEKERREQSQLATNFLVGSEDQQDDPSTNCVRIQTYVLLTSFVSWADNILLHEALSMITKLVLLTDRLAATITDTSPASLITGWRSWATGEETRRTIFAAYALCNLHCLVFGTSLPIDSTNFGLSLPTFAVEWRASDEAEWRAEHKLDVLPFSRAVEMLYEQDDTSVEVAELSSFANYILIHSVLQQICRQISQNSCGESLASLERALIRCKSIWESTNESTQDSDLDPLYAKGPLAMTGGALIDLAYVRLCCRASLVSRLVRDSSMKLLRDTHFKLGRTGRTHAAALACVHSLSVPARLGISFMTTTKTAAWSIEQSMCWAESAIFLHKWLMYMSEITGKQPLGPTEELILSIVEDIVKSTVFSATMECAKDNSGRIRNMASTVVKIFASIFQGVNVIDIENVIGNNLQHFEPNLL